MVLEIRQILEEDEKIFKQLSKLNLINQYRSAKLKLLSGGSRGLDFKLRKPCHQSIYSFRINQQYRAYAVEKDGSLIVFEINDHQ